MMSTTSSTKAHPRWRDQAPRGRLHAGIALVTSLLFLIMLSLLALPLLRSFGTEEKIAGSTREKERAFQAAENALEYGEWWLVDQQPIDSVDCLNPVSVAMNAVRVCSTVLSDPADPSRWRGDSSYKPPEMTVVAGGGTNVGAFGNTGLNSDINYARVPGLYVAYLGLSPDGADSFYSITSAGYGGGSDTTSVVQSAFKLFYPSKSLNGP